MGLRISRNSGKTWTFLFAGDFTSLQVSSNAQTMIAVDSTKKMRLSQDSGVTWTTIDPIGNGVLVNAARLAPDGKSMLIIGSDTQTYQASVAQTIP